MKFPQLLLSLFVFASISSVNAQSVSSELIEFQMLKAPKTPTNMQKGIDIWKETLTKVVYKDKNAEFNAKIAEFVYFNLIRLNIALGNKTEAEKYLNEFQENQIYMKLSYDDENELKRLETGIYK